VPTLSVELNGDSVHAIQAPSRFTTTGPFAVALENRGRSTHVHLHFDDVLDRIASVNETNHFVDDEATRRVHVSVDNPMEPLSGKLKIVTGYGSNTQYVDIEIDPPKATTQNRVAVDEDLSKPPEQTPEVPPGQRVINGLDRLIERGGATAAILAVVALVAGIPLALAVESTLVSVAVGLVLTISLGAALLALT